MSITRIEPIIEPAQDLWINLGSIESVETYKHKPHKYVPAERPKNVILLTLLFLKSVFWLRIEDEVLVPDGEPFWAYKIRLKSGRTYHIKQCQRFWSAWHQYHEGQSRG